NAILRAARFGHVLLVAELEKVQRPAEVTVIAQVDQVEAASVRLEEPGTTCEDVIGLADVLQNRHGKGQVHAIRRQIDGFGGARRQVDEDLGSQPGDAALVRRLPGYQVLQAPRRSAAQSRQE